MLYRKFGKTDWEISAIGQGLWNIGNQWGEVSDSGADRIIKTAVEQGINLFDVAESYGIPTGLSEIRLGRSLNGMREKVFIVSKIAWWGARTGQSVPKTTTDIVRLCGHACLGRLRTDWLDALLCHDANIQDPSVYIAGFELLKKEGFIREYGISTDSLEVLKRFYDLSDGKCAIVELNYSLINRAPENEILPYCEEKGIAVLARGPLARGILSGRYNADTRFEDEVRRAWNEGEEGRKDYLDKIHRLNNIQDELRNAGIDEDLPTLANRFVISHSAAPVAIPGATKYLHVINNASAGTRLLNDEERKVLRSYVRTS